MHGICNLLMKYYINFNFKAANLYNLKIFVANATTNLGFLETLGVAVAPRPPTILGSNPSFMYL